MTSPLQAAHDQAAAAAEPIVCTVAAPRQVAMVGVYTGAELRSRSSRPGAYDAMALPSLVNGRQSLPGSPAAAPVSYIPPAPTPPVTARAPVATSDGAHATIQAQPRPIPRAEQKERSQPTTAEGTYETRAGSVPDRVIKALQALPADACFSMAQIEAEFGLPVRQFYGTFLRPIERGALIFFRRASGKRERVIALPGFKAACKEAPQLHALTALTKDEATEVSAFFRALPEDLRYRPLYQGQQQLEAPPPSEFTPEQLDALYALSLREAELGLLLGYLAVMQLRKQFADGDSTYPFPPLTEPPRLTDAA